jgi:phage repressor protein C with HTH and peptisase S24 domain
VCKALKEDKFGRRLASLNPLYTNSAPPVIPAEEVDEIIGRVVWVQGALNGVEE